MSSTAEAGADMGDVQHGQTTDDEDRAVSAGDAASVWHAEIKAAGMREDKWRKKGLDIIARHRQERGLEIHSNKPTDKKTNILYSNTDVLLSHLCVDLGTPDVRRMFPRPGRKTKIARAAAAVLEKSMTVEGHSYDCEKEFEDCIEDACLPGRGQVWIDLEEIDGPSDAVWLESQICHVPWEFFRMGPARRWSEVPWVARMHLFSRSDLEDSFPEYADKIPLNYEIENTSENTKQSLVGPGKENVERAAVWEIWAKETRQRIYIAEDYPTVIKADDDPYSLKGFFPCPHPLYMIKTTNSLIPVPLFVQYQDQANELDRLTTRSYRLSESLKYCGIYGSAGDDNLPDTARLEDGEFVPYKNYQALQASGGLAAAFMVRDLAPIVTALQAVDMKIDATIQRIYEISGISDIMRGQSNPDTTATAEKFKARFGSHRSSRRQRMVQRFVREVYRIKAELIAEHYTREQLEEMTGISLPTRADQEQAKQAIAQLKAIQQQHAAAQMAQSQPMPGQPPMAAPPPAPIPVDPDSIEDLQETLSAVPWEDVQEIIRSNARRLFMVDVETDDTAFDDDEVNKEQAIAFMQAFMQTMAQIVPAVQQNPALLPLAKELVTFSANTFKVGQAFDDAINDCFDKISKQPPQASKDPKAAESAAKAQAIQQETQMKAAAHQADTQAMLQQHQADMAAKAQDAQQKQQQHQAEMQGKMADIQAKQERLALELAEHRAKVAQQIGTMGVQPNGAIP
jgi:hypothetical protein